jgi:4-hydroxy-tetrahydrodipicolinate reductase
MIKICVSGSKGKMGGRIIALAKNDPALKVAGDFDVGVDAEPFIKNSDCLIEFTSPQATMEHLAFCVRHKKAMVIGTTGLSDSERAAIQAAASKIPVVFAPNMSIGVNLLFKMTALAVKTLGGEYDIKIDEAHHAHKKDSPSGTAKELAAIARSMKADAKIQIDSVREGEIVGDHTVTFESGLDVIRISHSAKTRDIFARGALEAAKFVVGKTPKLYTMQEVLGI